MIWLWNQIWYERFLYVQLASIADALISYACLIYD